MVKTKCQIVRASVSRKTAREAVMAKSDVDAELFSWPLPFAGRSNEGSQVLEVIDLRRGVFELIPIHILQYAGPDQIDDDDRGSDRDRPRQCDLPHQVDDDDRSRSRPTVAFLFMWHTSELIIWRSGSASGAKMSVACRFLQKF